jgi:hypothetical protein
VVAQQAGGDVGNHAGLREDLHLDESGHPSVAVTERVNPRDVQVREYRGEDRVNETLTVSGLLGDLAAQLTQPQLTPVM